MNDVLFTKQGCPYCAKVLAVMDEEELGRGVERRDIAQDTKAREELVRVGGKAQVPCLVTGGRAMYESEAIIRHLRAS